MPHYLLVQMAYSFQNVANRLLGKQTIAPSRRVTRPHVVGSLFCDGRVALLAGHNECFCIIIKTSINTLAPSAVSTWSRRDNQSMLELLAYSSAVASGTAGVNFFSY